MGAPPGEENGGDDYDDYDGDYDDDDQGGLHLARLLVGVGHKATHKVGLAVVQGGHQLAQGDEVDGGDGLAATLLLLLTFLLGRGGWLGKKN